MDIYGKKKYGIDLNLPGNNIFTRCDIRYFIMFRTGYGCGNQ